MCRRLAIDGSGSFSWRPGAADLCETARQIAIGGSADCPNGLTRLGHLLRSMVQLRWREAGAGETGLVLRQKGESLREKSQKKRSERFSSAVGRKFQGRTGSSKKGDGSGSEAFSCQPPSQARSAGMTWRELDPHGRIGP